MNRIVIPSRVGADGILQLYVPIGAADADREVDVIIEAAGAKQMTQAEWQDFILATAGSITDPTFVRHDQSEYDQTGDTQCPPQ